MIVAVTGASQGIGKAIAQKFAAAAKKLIICGKTETTIKVTAAELQESYPNCAVTYTVGDLSQKQAADAFVSAVLQQGSPDILVNNAGIYLGGGLMDEADGQLEHLIANNLYSAYWVTRGLSQSFISAKKGHIFNISSIAGLDAYASGGGYSVSKFALTGFGKNLREELLPYGIKVTNVYPGAVYTNMWKGYDDSNHKMIDVNDIAAIVLSASQLSPSACVEDIVVRPTSGDL